MIGYRLVLPPGWYRITTGKGREEPQRLFLNQVLRTRSGADRVLAERELAPALAKLVAQAEENGVLDIYVYRRRLRGVSVSMNFSVAVVYLGQGVGDDELLALARGEAGLASEFVSLGTAARAVRTLERQSVSPQQFRHGIASLVEEWSPEAEHTLEATEREDARLNSTHIRYLVPIQGQSGSFLLVSFEVLDGPLADAEILHFDVIVSTLSWV